MRKASGKGSDRFVPRRAIRWGAVADMLGKPFFRRCLWFHLSLAGFLATPIVAKAHIGSPNVFFEGKAGPYPVRVTVRPPGVIPGLAEISVRANTNGIQRVTVLPIRWDAGKQGAPRPDEAKRVRGETNLFSGELWFMSGGAQSVEVELFGESGSGKVIVPVNAIATRMLGMPPELARILGALGVVLVVLAASIVGTAVRESMLPAGQLPTSQRRWLARASTVFAAGGLIALLAAGKRWWEAEARDYRNNRLYQPIATKASVLTTNSQHLLRLQRADPSGRNGPLVPDHGKIMHLFLVREPLLDAFAHLHPLKLDWKTFETALPDLPTGEYTLYADITYESGLSDTLTTQVSLPAPASPAVKPVALDPDDSWRIAEAIDTTKTESHTTAVLSPTHSMEWIPDGALVENRDTRLRFVVRNSSGEAVETEPYMAMRGHLILRRDDGSVFTHLHPSGSFSMAAQQLFEMRVEGRAPLVVTNVYAEPICRLPSIEESREAWLRSSPADAGHLIAFPYAFPKPGQYRLWVQTRVRGEVLTGVFDVAVASAKE